MANGFVAGAIVALAALPAAAVIAPPELAPVLRPSAAEQPALALSEAGVNIFECRPRADAPGGYAWTFIAPDATLYDGNRSVARRTSPNLWESTGDRTSVSGFARAAQNAGGDSLPWALYRAAPVGDSGLFAGVSSIQRVNTRGGVAPLTGCTADNAGAEQRVAFTADYYFYRPNGG
jgi:hypothetical protein